MGGRGGGGRWGNGGRGGGGKDQYVNNAGRNQQGRGQNVRESKEDVKKFLTFYKRKKSVCIDMYDPAFFKKRPGYDDLADFVYDILCPSDLLRADVEDLQLHPVKRNLFIKFRTEQTRDIVADKLAGEGMEWPAFDTKVQGWAMDKPMLFVRVLGASPESSREEVKDVLEQYGEVIEVKKGYLSKRLPNVTNGTWTVRMIVGENKVIPSFVFVKDDGEIWQLAHDNQETHCWKCGKKNHIGSRCREKAVSIEDDLIGVAQTDAGVPPLVQTWAHVVRGVSGQGQPKAVVDKAPENELEKQEKIMREHKEAEIRKEQADKFSKDTATAVAAKNQKVATEKAKAEKILAEKAKADRVEADRVEAERVETILAEKAEADRVEADRVEAARVEAQRVENDHVEDEPMEEEQVEKYQVEAEQSQAVNLETVNSPLVVEVKDVDDENLTNADILVGEIQVDKGVNISFPVDSILPPAKVVKLMSGSAVTSCGAELGSSPDLHHKVARPDTSLEKVENISSQHGSIPSPGLSGHLVIQPGTLEPSSDAGSSNAHRPDTPEEMSENSN